MATKRSKATMFKDNSPTIIKLPFTVDELLDEIQRASNGPPMVLVSDIGFAFKIDKNNLNKWLKKRGYEIIKVRMVETNGQLTNALLSEDARRACKELLHEGYGYR